MPATGPRTGRFNSESMYTSENLFDIPDDDIEMRSAPRSAVKVYHDHIKQIMLMTSTRLPNISISYITILAPSPMLSALMVLRAVLTWCPMS